MSNYILLYMIIHAHSEIQIINILQTYRIPIQHSKYC